MVYQRTIYLANDLKSVWDSIPTNERNEMIDRLFRNYAYSKEIDPNIKRIKNLELELQQLEDEKHNIDAQMQMKKSMLDNVIGGMNPPEIDYENEWMVLVNNAIIAKENNTIWRSYAGRAEYKVHQIKDGRIYLENVGTGRTTSNFQKGTFILGLQRLIDNGGRINMLEMIPVKMHEYAVVFLYPNIQIEGESIIFMNEDGEKE
jgi:hypothetical protein